MPKKTTGITVSKAAAAVGTTPTTVRKWLGEEKGLAKATKRENGVVVFPPNALKKLKEVRAARRAAASPALRKAWAARSKSAKGKKKAASSTKPRSAKGRVARKARRKSSKGATPALRKAWAARRANAAARRAEKERSQLSPPLQSALEALTSSVDVAVEERTAAVKARLREMLRAQRAQIDKALEELG